MVDLYSFHFKQLLYCARCQYLIAAELIPDKAHHCIGIAGRQPLLVMSLDSARPKDFHLKDVIVRGTIPLEHNGTTEETKEDNPTSTIS